ncbi:putative short-chain dehydrogenase/reductase [Durotheca rogersii]|uniref:putative short-chain dehydrogenase/reductase n=1 Tax=Durotheca rogersii TaxID=419775 RepID=UPI00221EF487|nr:putative short-chain dehydrogenase/reductase [Durotheca rogersii]KAI5866537.1 putative short-chain dehydrogenase/reductase [Durotheca rogersii]
MPPKSVLVTGCSEGGIGAALAVEFQARGCRVFATARDLSKMRSLSRDGVERLPLDVNSDASIVAAVESVRKATGGSLDYLVNNAGVNHVMPFTDAKVDDLRRVIETNVVAVLAVTHAFLPLLIEAKGVVATVGSVNEVFCPPYQVAYNASKAAVHAAMRTLRVELAPLGVSFVTIMTGSVRTKLFDNAPTKVPEDSLYHAVAEDVERRAFLREAQWVEPDVFAKQVVGDLLIPKPKSNVWRGGMSTIAWLLSWLGWEGMLDAALIQGNQLGRVHR